MNISRLLLSALILTSITLIHPADDADTVSKPWIRSKLGELPRELQYIISKYALSDETKRDIFDTALVHTLNGHKGYVHSAVFNPDSTLIASASGDKTIRLWDVNSGELLRTLLGHINWVRSAVFNPDGTLIASASDDRTVRVWSAPLDYKQYIRDIDLEQAAWIAQEYQTIAQGDAIKHNDTHISPEEKQDQIKRKLAVEDSIHPHITARLQLLKSRKAAGTFFDNNK